MDKDWEAFNKLCSKTASMKDTEFGSKHWASVYLANTPLQAAALGLKCAGVDEVAPDFRIIFHFDFLTDLSLS